MADALCGPSNALQNFKQHTSVDRSLQQDRLTGPRIPVQGFRTQDPRAGSLDADFHAFENAPANPFHEQLMGNPFHGQPQFQPSAPPNWANDFQQLRISDQPLPAQQFRNYAPMVKSTTGGWHNEFMRQQQSGQMSIAQEKQAASRQQNTSSYIAPTHYQGNFGQMSSFATHVGNLQFPQAAQFHTNDQLAGAEWSQAFEDAFQDAFREAEQTQEAVVEQEATAMQREEPGKDETIVDSRQAEQIRIGADAIDYAEMKDRTADQEKQDANALARVAGELLHNVQHDDSEKFQNSQFLDLMRKIRDRQVEVRNNDFETADSKVADEPSAPSALTSGHLSDQGIRNAQDPVQNQDGFAFPDMNAIYSARAADFVDYTFDSDQFPSQAQTQMSDLHPGGKLYPEQSPPGNASQPSGVVVEGGSGPGSFSNGDGPVGNISAEDFESAYDESRGLASRYLRTTA